MKQQIKMVVRCRELRVQAARVAYRKSSEQHDAAQGAFEINHARLAVQWRAQSVMECRIDAAFEQGHASGHAASAVRDGHAQMRRVLAEQVAAAQRGVSDAAGALARCRVECAQTERGRARVASLVEHLNRERERERERLDDAQCDDWRVRSG